MNREYYFPFGEKLHSVEQKDKSPKKAFVLGVQSSAVHACWLDKNGKEKVKALAVANEPEMFWKGDNAKEIIKQIKIPEKLGRLVQPRVKNLNGPLGVVLDEFFLVPLGLEREETWMCDLLPESRVCENQQKALDVHYTDAVVKRNGLRPANIPMFSKEEMQNNAEQRKEEILAELKASEADTLILLGDMPIQYFLHLFDERYKKLSDFGEDKYTYGKPRPIDIDGKTYNVIALCHPKNAGKLGTHCPKWHALHGQWVNAKLETMVL